MKRLQNTVLALLTLVTMPAWGSSGTSKQLDSFYAHGGGTVINTPSNGIWTVPNGGLGVATLSAHGVLIGNTTSGVNVTTAGTAGQVLTSNGASLDPTWRPATGGTSVQEFSSPACNSSTTVFTLAHTPTSNATVTAFLDGTLLTQGSGNDYTISSTTVTLSTSCATGQKLYFVYAF